MDDVGIDRLHTRAKDTAHPQKRALHSPFACDRSFGARLLHSLTHEHYFGTYLHLELAGQLSADDNPRSYVVIQIGSLDDPQGNQGDGSLLYWYDPNNAHAGS